MTDSPDTTISNAEATSFVPEDLAGPEGAIGEAVRHFSKMTLDVYSSDVRRIEADASIERGAIEGGYARRQLFELVQNGADELIGERGRIALLLTDEALYCANEGRPLT